MDMSALIIAALYLGLAIAYLLVIPFGLYVYLNSRWFVASSIERLMMYFLVFMFFPGLLLLTPFLNLRPQPRSIES